MQANRRLFLKRFGAAVTAFALPRRGSAVGAASQVELLQIVYSGGNWRPRPTALRRLAWEIHKRTAVDAALEPVDVKATTRALSVSAIAFLCGDRNFPPFEPQAKAAIKRFIQLGGLLIIDPAHTPDGDADGFEASCDRLLGDVLPGVAKREITPPHVVYRTFYQIERPVGRIEGPEYLTGYPVGDRLGIIRTHCDICGAFARDNLGNWEYSVDPGGERQREAAFRLGINLVLYALCLDYKNEEPHRRFGREME
jgi:hypothetical protein